MDEYTLEQKQKQFQEFFKIKHALNVNVRELGRDFSLPSQSELPNMMPYAFRIAGEMAELESKALRPLRHLGEQAADLAEFLNHQSRKIDLMMSYILQQQDEQELRYTTIEFGGGGVVIQSQTPMALGQNAELKIFLTEEASAVYCFAEVIACEPDADSHRITLIFTRIREEDQELLVRASLHLQTLQLRERAKRLKNESD